MRSLTFVQIVYRDVTPHADMYAYQRKYVTIILHQVNAYLCFSLAFFFNILLIWLIWKKTTKEMKNYSFILLQTCVIDLCLTFLSAFVQPVYLFIDTYLIFYQNGLARDISSPIGLLFFATYIFNYYIAMSANAVQFLYRYLVICSPAILMEHSFCNIRFQQDVSNTIQALDIMLHMRPETF
uniref:G-protein coupled receptors family 1 profile domain-containing protein n=1 Tax=Ditylenchus dipsaci TaxID=166011 RepID=A0A915DPZ7_9BILA